MCAHWETVLRLLTFPISPSSNIVCLLSDYQIVFSCIVLYSVINCEDYNHTHTNIDKYINIFV